MSCIVVDNGMVTGRKTIFKFLIALYATFLLTPSVVFVNLFSFCWRFMCEVLVERTALSDTINFWCLTAHRYRPSKWVSFLSPLSWRFLLVTCKVSNLDMRRLYGLSQINCQWISLSASWKTWMHVIDTHHSFRFNRIGTVCKDWNCIVCIECFPFVLIDFIDVFNFRNW